MVVTGGNRGLGFACAQALAGSGQNCCVIIAGHDREGIANAAGRLRQAGAARVEPMLLNLASQRSIHFFTENLAQQVRLGHLPPLHAVVCNAAVQLPAAVTHTADGYEQTFGVNYLGHFMLVNSLLPLLAEPGRVVVVGGGEGKWWRRVEPALPADLPEARRLAWPEGPEGLRLSGLARYRFSKQYLLWFAFELHRRLAAARAAGGPDLGVNVYYPSPTPGTGLARHWPACLQWLWHSKPLRTLGRACGARLHTLEESGRSLAGLVLDPALQGVSGRYFQGLYERHSMDINGDPAVAQKLWADCAELLRRHPGEKVVRPKVAFGVRPVLGH